MTSPSAFPEGILFKETSINEQSYQFRLNSNAILFPDDESEQSTSAGGSEPTSSGSEDERGCAKKVPKLKRVANIDQNSAWMRFWVALRCERRAAILDTVDWDSLPPKSKDRAITQSAFRVASTAVPAAKPGRKQKAKVKPTQQVTTEAPALLEPPPGLDASASKVRPPPGLELERRIEAPPGLSVDKAIEAPPGLDMSPLLQSEEPVCSTIQNNTAVQPHFFPTLALEAVPYCRKAFRKEVVSIFNDLRQVRTAVLNVSGAVHRIRVQSVPADEQPSLFSEMMMRAIEEMSGPGRRMCMAFVAGVAAGSPSAFDKSKCLAGMKLFFRESYDDLQEEVPRLPTRVREFLPALRSTFGTRQLNEVVPPQFRMAA